MISLTIARNPDGSEKHTLKNIKAVGDFCFNVATEQVWQQMVDTGYATPEGDSEFDASAPTPLTRGEGQFTTGGRSSHSFRVQTAPGHRTRTTALVGRDLLLAELVDQHLLRWGLACR